MRSPECGVKIVKTPLGWAGAAVTEKGVIAVVLPNKSRIQVKRELGHVDGSEAMNSRVTKLLERTAKLLERYCSGQTVIFDLPLDLSGYTAFQQAVWNAAAEIPFGETRSYGWIAQRIGKPKAARAVGQAMGANPVPVLVP